jgi:TolB-like protein
VKRIVLMLVLAYGFGGWPARAQDREMRTTAGTFAETLAKLGKKSVAVVDFTDLQGNVTELGRYLAEQMSVALALTDQGIEVIDRNHLKAILQENKLGTSGLIDPSTALKLGQLAGVQVLVTGTLTPFGDSVQLAMKALDSTTARIVAASTTDVAKTKAIEDLLNRDISSNPSAGNTVGGQTASSATNQVGNSGGARNPKQQVVEQTPTATALTGRITSIEWVNPHALLYIDLSGDKWAVELPAPNALFRQGWSRATLSVGETVTVTCPKNASNPRIAGYPACIATAISFAGREFKF